MKKQTKIWLVITGILLIVLGVVCICNPAETLFSMAWLIDITTVSLYTIRSGTQEAPCQGVFWCICKRS